MRAALLLRKPTTSVGLIGMAVILFERVSGKFISYVFMLILNMHAACNKHFRSLLPLECNSGGNSNPAIVAIMILIMCSVLMI